MGEAELQAHLASGTGTVCRCWSLTRRDGAVLGFTDHDAPLSFGGTDFVPDAGMSARAFEQSTGLSVDNSEAVGVLSNSSVTEADIRAGRYDGAAVIAWLVNWRDVDARMVLFRGTIGQIERSGGAFRAELRGLGEKLNQPQGRVFQAGCPAILGSAECGFDLDQPGYSASVAVETVTDDRVLGFTSLAGFADRWFERGRFSVQTGAASGLSAVVKNDRLGPEGRTVELWEPLPAPLAAGDMVRIEAGCDRRAETCRVKFANMVNFRGFPHLPGDDWLAAVPRKSGTNDGGSLRALMRAEIVAAARGWIGTPYVHQASCRGAGCDCLGLVRGVWREVIGAEPETPPAYSADWGEAARDEVLWRAARRHLIARSGIAPGAVLLFRLREAGVAKHLGIVSDAGAAAAFIHSYTGHGVVESPLSMPWRRRIAAIFDFPAGRG